MTARIAGFTGVTRVSLGKQAYASGKRSQWKLPQNIVARSFPIIATGVMACTFAGNKPVIRPLGLLDGMIDEMNISREGTDQVSALFGSRQMVHTTERQLGTDEGILYKVNSATLARPTLQGLPTFGATTQSTAFREKQVLLMENRLSGDWVPTNFSTLGNQSAQINVKWANVQNIQDPTDRANVGTFSVTADVEIFAVCVDYLLGEKGVGEMDYVRTSENINFGGQAKLVKKSINPPVGVLQGILFTGLENGDVPIDFEDMNGIYMEVSFSGIKIFEGSMLDMLDLDMIDTHATKYREGSAYLNFLYMKQFKSGLYIQRGAQIDIVFSTPAGLTYAPEFIITAEYDSIDISRLPASVTNA